MLMKQLSFSNNNKTSNNMKSSGRKSNIGWGSKWRWRHTNSSTTHSHIKLNLTHLLITLGLVFGVIFVLFEEAQGSHIPARYLESSRRQRDVSTEEEVSFAEEETDTTTNNNVIITDREVGTDGYEEGEGTTDLVIPSSSSGESKLPSTFSTIVPVSTTEVVGRSDVGESSLGPGGQRYKEVLATCNSSDMTVVTRFMSTFKGRVYAYGYSDEPECGITTYTSPSDNVTFSLPLGQCGVQMITVDPDFDTNKRHEVTLYIQYSSFLQQAIDEKISVSCVEIAKSISEDPFQALDTSSENQSGAGGESGDGLPGSSRQARRMGMVKDVKAPRTFTQTQNPPASSSSPLQNSQSQHQLTRPSSKLGEAWMEILHGKDPSPKSRKMQPVTVGQDITLVISTKVIRGYDARIVNCSANDGSRLGSVDGFRLQQISDSAGCSVDTTLVPNFRRRRLPIESRNRMITLHFATFPAFKFPEREHLHVKCQVAYCQGPCPQEPCDSGVNHFGTWREKYGRIADVLIDTTEIVNSIEVYAPELEDAGVGGHHFERHQSNLIPLSGSATDLTHQMHTHGQGRQLRFSPSETKSTPLGLEGIEMSEPTKPTFSGTLTGGSVCVSPGSVILALVILGVVLVISATATLWFALKRSEAKKYRQAAKHNPFQHAGPQPYYRFTHW